MKSREIRSRFLSFFEKRQHEIVPAVSLITSDERGVTNPTLFNTAGMQPLIPYLLGEPHPLGKRLVNYQRCLRTVDIDGIGDETHATFFEMLGNWSLGDYFKRESINWSYELLTNNDDRGEGDKGFGLNPNRLYITVFEGDSNSPKDEEAANIWREIFMKNNIPGERIFFMNAESNWWQAGDNSPCGPDTEIYYDTQNTFKGQGMTKEEFIKADSERKVIEIWNNVFMQYEKKDGKIIGTLPNPSVDTGAGLERFAMMMQNKDNIFETDLFLPLMMTISASSKDGYVKEKRIISDHIRASAFLIADGVIPSNTNRGYILRRLLRRAIRYADIIGLKIPLSVVSDSIGEIYGDTYPSIIEKRQLIHDEIEKETERFRKTLDSGLKEFNKINSNAISGNDAFKLFTSYGLPIDMIIDMAKEKNMTVDLQSFNNEYKKHQELSRIGAENKFTGGLADASDQKIIMYHTATHLLHQALHDVLGDAISQKGSNITNERLRFDFSHNAKMTDEEKMKVEDIVNEKIGEKLPVNCITLTKDEAEKTGARHFFDQKYGDQISIYYIGNDIGSAYSKEYCGGPHVTNTAELAGPDGIMRFHITKEEAVSQGVRRIRAVIS
ncbi:MAG: alanine--tRNA ligase [Candidatus Paceibacterota bacterium]|jgi:alanyl-tRNA synthetase